MWGILFIPLGLPNFFTQNWPTDAFVPQVQQTFNLSNSFFMSQLSHNLRLPLTFRYLADDHRTASIATQHNSVCLHAQYQYSIYSVTEAIMQVIHTHTRAAGIDSIVCCVTFSFVVSMTGKVRRGNQYDRRMFFHLCRFRLKSKTPFIAHYLTLPVNVWGDRLGRTTGT